MAPGTLLTWSLVVPVKVLATAKSRLAGLTEDDRAAIALAMAADTVEAALACPSVATVLVVSDDSAVRAELEPLGAAVLADRPGAGLNAALAYGAERAAAAHPGLGRAALTADVPALTARELDAALAAAAGQAQAFVADAAGTGTTLYAVRPGVPFGPRFGPMSRARHLLAGAAELALPDIGGLRQDVDTLADLRNAARIGVGRRTAVLLARTALEVTSAQQGGPAGRAQHPASRAQPCQGEALTRCREDEPGPSAT